MRVQYMLLLFLARPVLAQCDDYQLLLDNLDAWPEATVLELVPLTANLHVSVTVVGGPGGSVDQVSGRPRCGESLTLTATARPRLRLLSRGRWSPSCRQDYPPLVRRR